MALLRLADEQAGVVTRQQALGLGLPRSSLARLLRGSWQPLLRGVLLTHNQPPGWDALAWAGVLAGGVDARLGGYAAAHLHGLVDPEPEVLTILVPHHRGHPRRDRWNFVRERPGTRQALSVGTPPRTTIEDTVLDLAADRFHDGSTASPAHWVTVAIQRRMTTPAKLRRALARRPRLPGRAELADLLADTEAGAESPLELRYVRDVERAHGLPTGARQVRVIQHGTRRRRDVRYEKYGVLVELDGVTGHQGVDRFRDFTRDNAALLAGEVTLRYGWDDVTNSPCGVATQVAEMLVRGGWSGPLIPCDRCLLG